MNMKLYKKCLILLEKVSEKDIANIIENKKYKPSGWEAENFTPTVCCIGYIGCSNEKGKSNTTVYKKWQSHAEPLL